LKDSIERFLASLAPVNAETTIDKHRDMLGKLLLFCQAAGHPEPSSLSARELEAFYRWLCDSYNWGSVRRRHAIHSARRFLLWAYEAGETLHDLSDFPLPPKHSPPPLVLSVAVMNKLLSLPDGSTAVGQRDQAMLELLYVLGLRCRECAQLDLDALDLAQASLKVTGKGGHERLLPVSPRLLATLERYLRDGRRRLSRQDSEPALLLSYKGGHRFDRASIGCRVREYGRRLGLEIRPHLFRHACATHLFEAGMELAQIARLLGHESCASTRPYTRVSPRELRREFLRCHPRALREARP
jgi:site-specific recombinase XerD